MTVSSTINKASYNGDGSQSVFAYTFKIFVDADLQVYVGATLKTINTHYTLSGVGSSSGGNVTFTAGNIPAAGLGNVTLLRSLPLTQEVDLINYGKFDAEVVEGQYDKLTMMLQQLQEQTGRTIRFSTTVSDAGGIEISDTIAERKNKVLAYDANGDLSVANELGQWRGNWESNTSFEPRDLVVDPNTNNVYIGLLAHTSGTLNTDVSDLKFGLLIDASAVAASAATATTKAAEAAASAAATSSDLQLTNADVVLTHADVVLAEADKVQTGLDRIEAAGAASSSAVSAAAAANSAASAAAVFDNFDDKYLGAKSLEPSTNNDGDPLAIGNLYFRTGTGMQVYDGVNWISASSSGNVSMYAYEYVSIAGQTTFTGVDVNGQTLAYTANNIHVTYGGLDIPKADYVATNGTSIVLDDGALLGKIVRIIAFDTFVVANTYTKAQADALLSAKAALATPSFTGPVIMGTTTDGTIVDFRKDGTTVGSIGSRSGTQVYIGGGDAGLLFFPAGNQIVPHNTTTNAPTNAALDLGSSTAAFKDLYLSGGVYLGGTGSSNKLDDYEEGTWTPDFQGGTSISYSSRSGRYTKLGRMVYCTAELQVSSSGSDGSTVRIGGIPFTGNYAEESLVASIGRYSTFLGDKSSKVTAYRFLGDGFMLLENSNDAITYNEVASSGILQISFTYAL